MFNFQELAGTFVDHHFILSHQSWTLWGGIRSCTHTCRPSESFEMLDSYCSGVAWNLYGPPTINIRDYAGACVKHRLSMFSGSFEYLRTASFQCPTCKLHIFQIRRACVIEDFAVSNSQCPGIWWKICEIPASNVLQRSWTLWGRRKKLYS
jgi:hypothetical protein